MNDDPAKARFIAIQLVRLTGVVMVLFALLVLNGRVDLPKVAGYLIGVIGLLEAFVAPVLLAKRWKSPNE